MRIRVVGAGTAAIGGIAGLLRLLPHPVLAAIVLVAVTGLFKISALK